MLYTMKDISLKTGLPYETLKYYCNKGLIPNVKRDQHNHRIFDEYDLAWIKDLSCLRRCKLSINEMKDYLDLCLEGPESIPTRQIFLTKKRSQLLEEMENLKSSLDYLYWKQNFYSDILDGRREYKSNLIRHHSQFPTEIRTNNEGNILDN